MPKNNVRTVRLDILESNAILCALEAIIQGKAPLPAGIQLEDVQKAHSEVDSSPENTLSTYEIPRAIVNVVQGSRNDSVRHTAVTALLYGLGVPNPSGEAYRALNADGLLPSQIAASNFRVALGLER